MILVIADLTKEKKLLKSTDWVFRFDAVIKTKSIAYLVDVAKKHPDIQPIVFVPSFAVFAQYKNLKKIYQRLIVLFDDPAVPASLINNKIPVRYAFEIHPENKVENDNTKKDYITISTPKRDVEISSNNFLYIETITGKHRVSIHSYSQVSDFAGSINQIEKDNFDNLIRVHSSYLVNDKKIVDMNTVMQVVKLENGEELPFSRSNKKKIEKLLNR